MLLPKDVIFSPNFRGVFLRMEMAPSYLKHMNICVHGETNASCGLLKAMK